MDIELQKHFQDITERLDLIAIGFQWGMVVGGFIIALLIVLIVAVTMSNRF